MTHKADSSFFQTKRPWSDRKDLILAYYLKPYLPKVATQRRPILLVDGFAGPGRFGDGKDGSPVILCNAAHHAREAGLRVPVRVLCVERDASLCSMLRARLANFKDVRIENAAFQDMLPEIERSAANETVLLYLDPFTVKGLAWAALDRVFRWVQAGSSIEVLLNFSGAALTRIGCSLMGGSDPFLEEEEDVGLLGADAAAISDLDAVLGDSDWQTIITSPIPFPQKVELLTLAYCDRMRTRFSEVCWHDIKERSNHKVPKYTLVFGSRHPHALELMNDAAVKSRDSLAESEVPSGTTLFETRSEELVPDIAKIPEIIYAQATRRMSRFELVSSAMRADFGRYSSSQMRKAVGELVKAHRLQSSTGKAIMNDDVEVWRTTRP